MADKIGNNNSSDFNKDILENTYVKSDNFTNNKPSNERSPNNEVKNNNKGSEQISVFEINDKIPSKNNKKVYVSNGDLLEYRLKRLIYYMGYFPKVGVILKTFNEEQADMITDLDVYGFYIHKNFASKAIWADCKSGEAKPLERVSWILGVKSLAGIEDVIFVKRGVRLTTKQFARKSGIQVLDLDMITKLESDYNIQSNDWRGSWNPYIQLEQLRIFQKINIPTNDIYKRIGSFISSNYWSFDNYTKIKKTITALKQLSEIEQYPLQQEQQKAVRWAIFELINLFVLATLNICKELYYFPDKDKKDTLFEGLISGEISLKKRTEIVDVTYKIAYNIIRQQIPDFNLPIKIPNLGMEPPKYFEAFYNLILRITNDPLNYFDILRFLDFVLMEYDLESKNISEESIKKILSNYKELTISSKTILHFICSITGLRRDIFQLLK
ncbi:hypothetical protein [Clostridium beijerinckii]|uniref:Uncharacterized protein n=1 Tax=Clostridium beijerinckii TaxID=1520 RepID=A0A1S8S221_CLOBE|nr:hypothetical protein [Clostridium beijerinckii]NRY60676.1 hypothetical protein [Clostridium beijerinckii]OOM59295.1 hypothetical protein CLBCK_35940 [Clostridium beijerinckii]